MPIRSLAVFLGSIWFGAACFVVETAAYGFGGPWRSWRTERARRKAAALVQENLVTRRTINEFHHNLPSDWETAITDAIHAATYAPNHKRTEPWRFHLLGKESIRTVCELNAKLVAERKGDAAGAKKLERWMAIPGWIVVTCQQSKDVVLDLNDPMGRSREDYAACCCAVQNLCLSLHANGLGTKWTTGPVNFHAHFASAIGLSDSEYVVGTIWFGTPTEQPKPPVKKLSMDEVLVRHP